MTLQFALVKSYASAVLFDVCAPDLRDSSISRLQFATYTTLLYCLNGSDNSNVDSTIVFQGPKLTHFYFERKASSLKL